MEPGVERAPNEVEPRSETEGLVLEQVGELVAVALPPRSREQPDVSSGPLLAGCQVPVQLHARSWGTRGWITPGWPSGMGSGPSVTWLVSTVSTPAASTSSE